MSSLDLELDSDLNDLETQWRRSYQACMDARADYEKVLGCNRANGGLIDVARLRLERVEALQARLRVKMERTEESLIKGSQT